MKTVRQQLHIFILSDMVQIKRGRKSIELMPLDEADALGRDLCLAVAAARATQPWKQSREAPESVAPPLSEPPALPSEPLRSESLRSESPALAWAETCAGLEAPGLLAAEARSRPRPRAKVHPAVGRGSVLEVPMLPLPELTSWSEVPVLASPRASATGKAAGAGLTMTETVGDKGD